MALPSRLFFDIETRPGVFWAWDCGKTYLAHYQILESPGIICVSWLWEGNKNVRSLTWDQTQNPRKMLSEFVPIMHKADEIVAHGGDRFDIPWVRAECMRYDLPMSPDFVSIDTLKLSRANFHHPSHRLDFLGKHYGLGRKVETGGKKLWERVVFDNDRAALRKMVSYNKQDVRLLAAYWAKLNRYIKPRIHRGHNMAACPECGSSRTIVSKHRVTAAGYHKVQYHCRDCGKFHSIAASRFYRDKDEAHRDG